MTSGGRKVCGCATPSRSPRTLSAKPPLPKIFTSDRTVSKVRVYSRTNPPFSAIAS